MTTKKRVIERKARQGMLGGRGKVLGYEFFRGEMGSVKRLPLPDGLSTWE